MHQRLLHQYFSAFGTHTEAITIDLEIPLTLPTKSIYNKTTYFTWLHSTNRHP